jgi:hypothetical protein
MGGEGRAVFKPESGPIYRYARRYSSQIAVEGVAQGKPFFEVVGWERLSVAGALYPDGKALILDADARCLVIPRWRLEAGLRWAVGDVAYNPLDAGNREFSLCYCGYLDIELRQAGVWRSLGGESRQSYVGQCLGHT